MPTARMFDKFVNVTLKNKDGSQFQVTTPAFGRKPTIRITGKFVCSDLIQQAEVRMTNLVTRRPLSSFGSAVVEAGYVGSIKTAFEGKILNAFQELPGPDGVTTFQMIIGNVEKWMESTLTIHYPAGTALRSVCQDVADALDMGLLIDTGLGSLTLQLPLHHNGLAKDILPKLGMLLFSRAPDRDQTSDSVMFQPFGKTLIVYRQDKGTGRVHRLDFISHAKHNAAGFEIQAPWEPTLVPGDLVQVDPKYFRQDIGGAVTIRPAGNRFLVILLDFEFCTTDDTNMMSIVTVGAGV